MAVVFVVARSDLGPDAVQLMPEVVVPVCAPALRDGRAEGVLPDAPLVHLDALQQSVWFRLGELSSRAAPGPRTGSCQRRNAVQHLLAGDRGCACGAGGGARLGGLVDRLLVGGHLVEAGPELAMPDRGYFLVSGACRAIQGQRHCGSGCLPRQRSHRVADAPAPPEWRGESQRGCYCRSPKASRSRSTACLDAGAGRGEVEAQEALATKAEGGARGWRRCVRPSAPAR